MLGHQFCIYEFDKNLNILQKIKIPHSVFKNFVEKFPRWEFESLMAFRLNQEEIDFFSKYCVFKPFDLKNCVDIFLENISYYLFNLLEQKLMPISREYFQNVCKNFPREYPSDLNQDALQMLSAIIQKKMPNQMFFTPKDLILDIYQNDESYFFEIQNKALYEHLFTQFTWRHQIDFQTAMLFLKEEKINFNLSKEAKITIGYSIADDIKMIQIILQYEKHFEIYHPTRRQRKIIEELFYKALPNTNFLLGVYPLQKGQYLMPQIYINLYEDKEEGKDFYALEFNPKLFSKQTLKRMLTSWNGFKFDCIKISTKDKNNLASAFGLELSGEIYFLQFVY